MSVLKYDIKTAISAARKIAMEEGKKEGMEAGIEKGIEKGKNEGIEEGEKRVLKLMEQGLSYEEIRENVEEKTQIAW